MKKTQQSIRGVRVPEVDNAEVVGDVGDGTPGWVVLRLGSAEFGLPIERVREVLQPPQVTRVPLAPRSVLGVASVRREVVPVVDLGERVVGRASQRGRLVIVTHGPDAEPVGLLVDAVSGLISRAARVLDSPPPEVGASLEEGLLADVVESGDRSIVVLDIDRVLDIALAGAEEVR